MNISIVALRLCANIWNHVQVVEIFWNGSFVKCSVQNLSFTLLKHQIDEDISILEFDKIPFDWFFSVFLTIEEMNEALIAAGVVISLFFMFAFFS